ncbi:hypothetical protein ABZ897_08575 [Nonomuraea sp. NPDC046802]|uniref:hypothetical protein n=1 Tax=Nonomuraea sp. NPDC046802 TaxID=3154919 RepID=UPI0033DC80C5
MQERTHACEQDEQPFPVRRPGLTTVQPLLMGLFDRQWTPSVVLNGMVRGARGTADDVVR